MNLNNIKEGQKTLVDVRTPNEYASEHVPGAINIPMDQIQNRLDELKGMPKPIITYCRSGTRSGMATSILMQAGIKEVFNGGGITEVLLQIKMH